MTGRGKKVVSIESDKVERRRKKLMQEFASCADFINDLEDEVIEEIWSAAKGAPKVSWFLEEQVGNTAMIWLEQPIFYSDRSQAAAVASSASEDKEVEAIRLMKWTRASKKYVIRSQPCPIGILDKETA